MKTQSNILLRFLSMALTLLLVFPLMCVPSVATEEEPENNFMKILVEDNLTSAEINGNSYATKDVSVQFKAENINGVQAVILAFDKTKVAPITTVDGAAELGADYLLSDAIAMKDGYDYNGKFDSYADVEAYFYALPTAVKDGIVTVDEWAENGVAPVIFYAEIGDTGYVYLMFKQNKIVSYDEWTTGISLRFASFGNTVTAYDIRVATTAEANSLNALTSAHVATNTNNYQVLYLYFDDGTVSQNMLAKPVTEVVLRPCYVIYAGGNGATGAAPAKTKTYEGSTIILPENTFSKDGFVFAGWTDGVAVYQPGDMYTVAADITFTATWLVPPEMRLLVTHNSQKFNALQTKDVSVQVRGEAINGAQAIMIAFDKTKVAPISTVSGSNELGNTYYITDIYSNYTEIFTSYGDVEQYFYTLPEVIKSGMTVTDSWTPTGVAPVIYYAEVGNTAYIYVIVKQDKIVSYDDFSTAVTLRFAVLDNSSITPDTFRVATTAEANALNSSNSALMTTNNGTPRTYIFYDSGSIESTLKKPQTEVQVFTISGLVQSENPNKPIQITLKQDGEIVSDTVIEAQMGAGLVTQDFLLSVKAPGTYTLIVKKSGALPYTITNLVITDQHTDLSQSSSSGVSLIKLISGDINDDGYIDTLDISSFVFDFGKPLNQAKYANSNINGDDYIDALDVAILAAGLFKPATSVEYMN